MNVLLLKPDLLRATDRDGHDSSLLGSLLAIASYVQQPTRLRIAVSPDDAGFIRDSLPWADAIGFSACTFEYEHVRRLARGIRQRHPDKLVFLGGYHVSLLGACDPEVFDFSVVGEGEQVVRDLVEDRGVPVRGSAAVLRAAAPLAAEELPVLDYTLYPGVARLRRTRGSLIASRGCRFPACRFCTSSRLYPRLRRWSVERVAEQVARMCRDLDTDQVNLWDDNFSDDPAYLADLVGILEARRLRLREVSCFARVTSPIDPTVFPLFQRLGVTTLVTGFESGNARVLAYLKGPQADPAHTRRNCLLARDAGCQVLASVLLGSPTETLDEMRETVDLLAFKRDQRVAGTAWVYAATPLPGSRFWTEALARGTVRPDMDFSTLSFDNFAAPLLLDPGVSREGFAQVVAEAQATAAACGRVPWTR